MAQPPGTNPGPVPPNADPLHVLWVLVHGYMDKQKTLSLKELFLRHFTLYAGTPNWQDRPDWHPPRHAYNERPKQTELARGLREKLERLLESCEDGDAHDEQKYDECERDRIFITWSFVDPNVWSEEECQKLQIRIQRKFEKSSDEEEVFW